MQRGIQWSVILPPTRDPIPLASRSSFLCILLEICKVQTGTRKHTHGHFLLWKLAYAPHTAVHLDFWLWDLSWIFPNWHAYGSTTTHLAAAYPLHTCMSPPIGQILTSEIISMDLSILYFDWYLLPKTLYQFKLSLNFFLNPCFPERLTNNVYTAQF